MDTGDAVAPATPELTSREQEVMRHAVTGLTSAQIGAQLGISEHTVRKHFEHVYAKLAVHNRAAAVARTVTEGFAALERARTNPTRGNDDRP
jgi:DNA-binding CsgD family transcriptional regulator